MLKEVRKKGFMMVALIAVVTAMFKLSVVETATLASPSKSHHSSKTAINYMQNATSVLLYESDSEEFDNEEADDEVKSLWITGSYFTQFQAPALCFELHKQHEEWAETAVKGSYPPIYLVNRNFRL
ncbi:MAG TPA: hypothetical protein VK151_02520 [Fluviicola sp.]|nr:hypothetical protein [Fluviicola sp.]